MKNKEQKQDKCPTCKHEKSFQFCSSGFHKEQNTGMQPDEETRVKIADAADDYRKQFNNLPAQRFNAFVAGALWQSSQPINSGWVSAIPLLEEVAEMLMKLRINSERSTVTEKDLYDVQMNVFKVIDVLKSSPPKQ